MEVEGASQTHILTTMDEGQLAAWNATRQTYPQDTGVPQLVGGQAEQRPDAVAAVAGGQALSYRELNECANQLAHYLQSLGVQPETPVGVCVERSLDLIVGLLGVLKAGGAYVPLDPAYPSERLAFMLKDSQAPVLVAQEHFISRLPGYAGAIVCLDADAAQLAQQDRTDPTSTATLDNLAYIIYTSGSTGQPKGVQITHSSLLNLVFWHQRAFELTPADRATQLTSPAFDATGWEVWPYLTCGASVQLPDEETRVSPAALRDWLEEQQITITFLPTVLAESVLALEWSSATSLRFLLTGADTLHHYPSASLPFAFVNNYGPTEATVVATSGRVFPAEHVNTPPSIGRPITNTQIYILDEHLRQVSIGTPGELYIGGAGLARGYLNRPELTAECFILHPFSSESGARLYKTGDLAHYLPDGNIGFLGRADDQIKIRGYRIEPDEIVAALNGHPAVQTSLVVAREDASGDKRLIAYLVPAAGASVTASALREALARHLPDYMLPTAFVYLEAFPLTPHGKVDRAALPLPNESNTLRDEALAAPSTLIEQRIAEIIAALLNIEQVSVDNNFFMLGGHSMMGAQLIMQATETFGVELSLHALFEHPTIRQLSAEVERLIVAKLETLSEEAALSLLEQGQSSRS